MTVQVNNINKAKSKDGGVITLFAGDKFEIKNLNHFFINLRIKLKFMIFQILKKKFLGKS